MPLTDEQVKVMEEKFRTELRRYSEMYQKGDEMNRAKIEELILIAQTKLEDTRPADVDVRMYASGLRDGLKRALRVLEGRG